MFQTDFNIFLQSFSSGFLTVFFNFITTLGYDVFVRFFLIVIIFGVSYRLGFMLLQLVMWNGILTDILKETFRLPRPVNVDSAVQVLELGFPSPNPTPLASMGAKSFFGSLPREAVEYMRLHHTDSYGFPSGHSSGAIALWGGLVVLFRKKWLTIPCVLLMILIPLSRLYLGRHFLADVTGGLVLGLILLIVFTRIMFRNEPLKGILFKTVNETSLRLKSTWPLIGFLFVLPILLLFAPVEYTESATILGVNLGFFLVWLKGVPDDSGNVLKRLGRILTAGILFLAIHEGLKPVSQVLGHYPVFNFVYVAVTMCLFFYLATEVNVRLGMMKRQSERKL
jgi:membrane-associated phospholipid phosphatase